MIIKIIEKLPKLKDVEKIVTKEQHKLFKVDSIHEVEKGLGIYLIDNKFAELTEDKPEEEEEDKDAREKGYYVLQPFSLSNVKLTPGHKLTDIQIEAADLKFLLNNNLIEKVK